MWLIDHFNPRYLIHGHMHVYDKRIPTVTVRGKTTVVKRLTVIDPGYRVCP